MKWYVFKESDPDTWPKINCPMVVFKEYSPSTVHMSVCKWDDKLNEFFEDDGHHYKFKACFYSYIGYQPYIEKELHPIACGHTKDFCPYGHDDNGYCMCDDDFKCEHQIAKTEYALGMKRIWKEF